MIDLLPQSEKKKLLKTYRLRIGVLLLAVLLGTEVLAAALFLPTFYVLNSTTENLALELEQKRQMTPEGEGAAQQELALIKQEVAMLKPSTETLATPPSILFSEILIQKPDGISIDSIAYARDSKNASVQLSGNARTSGDMLSFQKNLKENPRIAGTQYSSNSFIIKKTDIDFIMTVTLK